MLRWGIAAIGIWYVLRNISLHNTVMVPSTATGRPVAAQVTGAADESGSTFTIVDPNTLTIRSVARTDLLVRPGRAVR